MGDGGFYAARGDRLGSRLGPIINAYYFARRYGRPFRFGWPMRSGVEPPETIMRSSLVTEHRLRDVPNFEDVPARVLRHRGFMDYLCSVNSSDLQAETLVRFHSPYGVYVVEGDDPSFNRRHASQAFIEDVLRPDLLRQYADARATLPPEFVAVHLRRGNLKECFDGSRCKDLFRRYCPASIAPVARDKFGLPVVVFSDNPEVAVLGDGIYLANELVGSSAGRELGDQQLALRDCYLVGAGKYVVAGSSGFLNTATMLSSCETVHPSDLLSPAEYAATLLAGRDDYFEFTDSQLIRLFMDAGKSLTEYGRGAYAEELLTLALERFRGNSELIAARKRVLFRSQQAALEGNATNPRAQDQSH